MAIPPGFGFIHMKTHTNGPWSANLNGLARDKQDAPQWTVGKSCECLVILPNRSTPEETEANARLIAAAPDLLAAAIAALTIVNREQPDGSIAADLLKAICKATKGDA